MRKSSTGDLNLLDKITRPAVIISVLSRKLTMGAAPGTQCQRVCRAMDTHRPRKCLDHILILNEAHLRNVRREYVENY